METMINALFDRGFYRLIELRDVDGKLLVERRADATEDQVGLVHAHRAARRPAGHRLGAARLATDRDAHRGKPYRIRLPGAVAGRPDHGALVFAHRRRHCRAGRPWPAAPPQTAAPGLEEQGRAARCAIVSSTSRNNSPHLENCGWLSRPKETHLYRQDAELFPGTGGNAETCSNEPTRTPDLGSATGGILKPIALHEARHGVVKGAFLLFQLQDSQAINQWPTGIEGDRILQRPPDIRSSCRGLQAPARQAERRRFPPCCCQMSTSTPPSKL